MTRLFGKLGMASWCVAAGILLVLAMGFGTPSQACGGEEWQALVEFAERSRGVLTEWNQEEPEIFDFQLDVVTPEQSSWGPERTEILRKRLTDDLAESGYRHDDTAGLRVVIVVHLTELSTPAAPPSFVAALTVLAQAKDQHAWDGDRLLTDPILRVLCNQITVTDQDAEDGLIDMLAFVTEAIVGRWEREEERS